MRTRNQLRCVWAAAGFVILVAIEMMATGMLHAQELSTDPGQAWEQAAGGKQQFDVASVREDKGNGPATSNFPLDGGNVWFTVDKSFKLNPEGSLLSAKNLSLVRYIVFAYKLSGTQELALRFDFYQGLETRVPHWVRGDQNDGERFDIEARAAASVTKDQMRLMMQSLLAERFKLQVHWETQQAPVFELVEATPGKLGPQMEANPASDDCSTAAVPEQVSETASGTLRLGALPIPCGMIAHLPPSAAGAHRFGGRNVQLAMLADSMPTQTGMATLRRPVVDGTGLKGGYNFWIDWTPEDTRNDPENGETGGTFREALKNQLGLKLVAKTGPMQLLVIDHVEEPSEN
ncbi:MAG: TIGR03435 family protein [Terracidiphilus sp.]